MGNQVSLSNPASQYQQQQEQIEKQRGRYRFRGESADTRKSASQSSSPGKRTNEKAGKKKKKETLVSSLSPTIPPTTGEITIKPSRSGPATTFEEILNIDGALGADCALLDDFAFCVSGSSTTEFGTGFKTRRMGKDPVTRITKAYADSVAIEEGYPATESAQLSFFRRVDPSAPLISTAAELGVIDSDNWDQMEPLSRWHGQIGVSADDETPGDDQQEIKKKWLGLKCTDLELYVDSQYENRSALLPSPLPTSSVSDSSSEDRASMIVPEHGSHIPQVDGSCASRQRNLSDPSSTPVELPERPDPFGFRATIPTEDAIRIAEDGHPVSFFQRLKALFTSNVRNIKSRAVHAFTTGPDLSNDTDNMNSEESYETEEDIGTRKAKAVVRSWSRTGLVICYSW